MLAPGHRLQQPQAPAALRASHELGRAQDGRCRRGVHEVAAGHALRRPPDAARVEELRLGVEEGRVVARPAAAEAEKDLAALGEERALLFEERLEGAQVHHGGIHLDLSEVRVHGAHEGHAAGDAVLEVETRPSEDLGAVVPGVARPRGRHVLGPARDVGQKLHVAAGKEAVHALESRHARGQAALVLGHEGQPRALVLAIDHAARVDAPLVPRGRGKPELRQGDPHLHGPARGVDAHRRRPDGVPGVVLEVVVVEGGVSLHAGGADLEHDAGPPVAVRVEVEGEGIRLRDRVAPRELPRDPVGPAVDEARRHVERLVVEEQAQLGGLARRLPLVGVALQESRGDGRLSPGVLLQTTVHLDRAWSRARPGGRAPRGGAAGAAEARAVATEARAARRTAWRTRFSPRQVGRLGLTFPPIAGAPSSQRKGGTPWSVGWAGIPGRSTP